MTFKYAVYKINTDAWIAYCSDIEIKENGSIIKISEECYNHLQKIKSFPCGNDGSTINLENRIIDYKNV